MNKQIFISLNSIRNLSYSILHSLAIKYGYNDNLEGFIKKYKLENFNPYTYSKVLPKKLKLPLQEIQHFIFEDYVYEIFGKKKIYTYPNVINDFNELVNKANENQDDIILVSSEFKKTLGQSLYFITQNTNECRMFLFNLDYSNPEKTINSLLDNQILVTEHPAYFNYDIYKVIKFNTIYNKDIESKQIHSINSFRELINILYNNERKQIELLNNLSKPNDL